MNPFNVNQSITGTWLSTKLQRIGLTSYILVDVSKIFFELHFRFRINPKIKICSCISLIISYLYQKYEGKLEFNIPPYSLKLFFLFYYESSSSVFVSSSKSLKNSINNLFILYAYQSSHAIQITFLTRDQSQNQIFLLRFFSALKILWHFIEIETQLVLR